MGCQQRKEPTPAPPEPPKPVAIVVDAAPVVDTPPDADETFKVLEAEAFGGIHNAAPAAEVIAVLGPPKKKSKPIVEGATGNYVSDWDWPSASAIMTSETDHGPWIERNLSIGRSSKLETRNHIKIGSSRAEVEAAYPRSEDDQKDDPNRYLSGSMYGGVMFSFEKDKVVGIAMGPFAF